MKYILPSFLFLFFSLISFHSQASHIVGGEIYYDYLGNNNYRIYISVYRDCQSTGAPYDTPLPLTVFQNSTNTIVQTYSVTFPGSQILPVVFNNPCVTPPSGICIERAIYTVIVNLPPSTEGYTLAYQRCCRGPNITNLSNPDDTGLTLWTKIPGLNTNSVINSSPRFTNYPPLVLCNNDDLVFDHSATDPDGDQLTYELISPALGGSSASPAPNPAPTPPYAPVVWAGGYTAASPLGPGSSISINPTTGLLIADPNLLGLYVVGIRVKEFRNGVQIGQTDRDFLFRVVNCVITLSAEITPQDELPGFIDFCQGTTVVFDNQSFGGSVYAWDFGVPGITTDVSTQFEPTYTFPSPGTYNVTLIVNPGWPCSDTTTQEFQVYQNLTNNFTFPTDNQCLIGNSFDFNGSVNGPAGSSTVWDFGSSATPLTAATEDVNGVSFSTSGTIPVTMTTTFGNCEASTTKDIHIIEEPAASFSFPLAEACSGLEVTFTNATPGSPSFDWDFGVSGTDTDVSTQTNPTFEFPAGGTYTVQLIAYSNAQCRDTFELDVTVQDQIQLSITNEATACIRGNAIDFSGVYAGPANPTFTWNFGSNANPQTSNLQDVTGVNFSTPGVQTITLEASVAACSSSASTTIQIYDTASVDFGINLGLQCTPYFAYFKDSSVSDTPLIYSWDFGDGQTSNAKNPLHIYETAGNYSVSLTVYETTGCMDTLSMTVPNLVQVKQRPTANFIMSPSMTDICHPLVTFTDLSIDGYTVEYFFDEENQSSTGKNAIHTYAHSGTINPYQVVTNEYMCKDTLRKTLLIEPVTLYIPNTFTPDGNEVNNIFNPIMGLESQAWDLKIFNRWGQFIFHSSDPAVGWNGLVNDQLAPDGMYIYKFRYISCENTDVWIEKSGHFNLLH